MVTINVYITLTLSISMQLPIRKNQTQFINKLAFYCFIYT